jgi:hypothetical protein
MNIKAQPTVVATATATMGETTTVATMMIASPTTTTAASKTHKKTKGASPKPPFVFRGTA